MTDGEHIGAEEAARILKVSARMVYRYGEDGKIRTIRAGRRILFNHADVLAYADETAADNKPPQQTSIIRADEMLLLVREQQQQLLAAAQEIGDLRARLDQRLLPADVDTLKDRIHQLEREADRLQFELERERERHATQEQAQGTPASPESTPARPWWQRILGS